MSTARKETLINVVVMLTLVSVSSIVLAAKNNWRLSNLVSLEEKAQVQEPLEIAQADEPINSTPTPVPTFPPSTNGPCPCAPPATPTPGPIDTDVPPTPTPTPDTSGATPPFVITVGSLIY